jgi:ATP-dependent RNA helicase RhlE
VAEDYVHRIGRTGRAGAAGQAHSLVSADEVDSLAGIEQLIRKNLPREEVEGFEPEHRLPERTAPAHKPSANRRPRKAGGNGNPQARRRNGGGRSRSRNRQRAAARG